ncbi:hypothetical protein Csa_004406 [Cucumis sativus]|uniref:Uncharacterized protein n=1 Tax=Cucumis sativus TaxID=3659 RepID=A0A0A0KG91_CUCSA|nr:hypothetical protein Csa_004406 [Cucumis sativus]
MRERMKTKEYVEKNHGDGRKLRDGERRGHGGGRSWTTVSAAASLVRSIGMTHAMTKYTITKEKRKN